MAKNDPEWLQNALASGQATEGPSVNLSALYGASSGLPEPPKQSKYRSRKVEIDGRTFDSKKEANRYLDLVAEQKAGGIAELSCQMAFPLYVNDSLVCTYVADFVYFRNGVKVIEDVKSAYTRKIPVYRIKKKLMAALGFEITEV